MTNAAEAQLANVTLKFLERVDLKGNEFGAFSMVINWLQAKATAAPESPDLDQDREAAE